MEVFNINYVATSTSLLQVEPAQVSYILFHQWTSERTMIKFTNSEVLLYYEKKSVDNFSV